MVAKTRTSAGGNTHRRLKFNEKLVGKGLTTDSLLKKLKALHAELAELDQDNVEVKSLNNVCKELVSTSILLHKDQGVKAYAACCLADLLKLYAPDAPYTGPELRDIFQFFFRQLSTGLKGSDSPYYNQYFHLLESLSTVKSVVLVCDLPNADELMVQIFRDFFSLVRHDLAKNVEMYMGDILMALIDECQSLPADVLETIMAQFMEKNPRLDHPSYRLAVEVCNAASDKLQRHVCQYFTDIIVQHSQNEEYDEVRTAHELIKRLNHSCPSLLHNVVPQLEEELRVEEVELRQMATHTLGEMFGDKSGTDLYRKYQSTWSHWIARRNDKATTVRLAFVETCAGLLSHAHSEIRAVVEEALGGKFLDPDERVRAAVCKLYSQLDFEISLHFVSEKQLRTLAGRCMDKKQSVRQEALTCLGKLYGLAYPQIEGKDPIAIRQFGWIPQHVFSAISATIEVKDIAVQVVAEHILPLPAKGEDEAAWTDRLLVITSSLDEKGIKVLVGISGIKTPRPTIFERYVTACVENNGGIIDANEDVIRRKLALAIRHISSLLSDPQRATEHLDTFAKLNEQRLYKLLKTAMDPATDLKGLIKSLNEFHRRLEQSSPATLPTMMSVVRQATFWVLNQSSIPTLLRRLEGENPASQVSESQATLLCSNAKMLLRSIAKYCPHLFLPHTGELAKGIIDEDNDDVVEICLQALASLSKSDADFVVSDKRTIERVSQFIHGPNPRHAKFAARILAYSKDKEQICLEIVNEISGSLANDDPERVLAHLAVLSEFAQSAADAFEQCSDLIIAFVLKNILLEECPIGVEAMVDGEELEWAEESQLSLLAQARLLGLKLCRRRCLTHAGADAALDIANPVIKMLFTALENAGSVKEGVVEDPRVKSRTRLQAAVSLLQLATVEKFAEVISGKFVTIALTIQDPCFEVRLAFLTKLVTLLHTRKLHPRYNLIPFLTIHDPESEIKDLARSYVTLTFKRAPTDVKLSHFEMIFIRLLHLLAHHPDFGTSRGQVKEISMYIIFYLDLIANGDNLSLLYHLAMKAKTVRDAEGHTYSENLYALSELAQEIIRNRSKASGWSLNSYPGKVKLPSDIFRALPNSDAASKILKTVYLPEDALASLEELAKEKVRAERSSKAGSKRKSAGDREGGKTKRKGGPKRGRAKRRRKNTDEDDDEDDDQDEDDANSDDDGVGGRLSDAPTRSRSRRSSIAEDTHATTDEERDRDAMDEDKQEDQEDQEEKLGRGARTRAKARKAKRGSKPNSG